MGSAGRTDLLGEDATDELTRAQYGSLRRWPTLPEDIAVLPTHGAGSFCTAGPVDGARTSTIGLERRTNPLLQAPDEAAFRAALLGGLGPYPTYYREMAPLNRAGHPWWGDPPCQPRLDAAGFRGGVAAGAHLVDGRPRADFAAGHVPGSLNIELGDTFASYVGWFVPFGAPVALVLPEPLDEALEEATVQLFRIGYDRVAGALAGGVAAWAASGAPLDAYPTTRSRRSTRRRSPAGTRTRSTCATNTSGARTAPCPGPSASRSATCPIGWPRPAGWAGDGVLPVGRAGIDRREPARCRRRSMSAW